MSTSSKPQGEDRTCCCEKFAEQAGNLQAPAGGGFLYPAAVRPSAQFKKDDDGTWNINGCCGGGCYVVTEMRYCPYCGTSLIETKGREDERDTVTS